MVELVLGSVDDTNDKVVNELKHRIAKCCANIDWVSGSCKSSENESILLRLLSISF